MKQKMYPEIKQIVQCNENLHAVFEDTETNEEFKVKVLAFALCDDGCVYPLLFDYELGIGLLTDGQDAIRFEL